VFEKISTHSRARQILQKNVRKFRKFTPQSITTEFERKRTMNQGMWIERSDLARLSGTQFVKPSLHFNVSFLMRANKEARDDRVHQVIPLIPTVEPVFLHEQRNYILGRSGPFKGRDPDTKYKKARAKVISQGDEHQANAKSFFNPEYPELRHLFDTMVLNHRHAEALLQQRSQLGYVNSEEEAQEWNAKQAKFQAIVDQSGIGDYRKYVDNMVASMGSTRWESPSASGGSNGETTASPVATFSTSYSSVDRLPDDASEDTDLTLPSTDEE